MCGCLCGCVHASHAGAEAPAGERDQNRAMYYIRCSVKLDSAVFINEERVH